MAMSKQTFFYHTLSNYQCPQETATAEQFNPTKQLKTEKKKIQTSQGKKNRAYKGLVPNEGSFAAPVRLGDRIGRQPPITRATSTVPTAAAAAAAVALALLHLATSTPPLPNPKP